MNISIIVGGRFHAFNLAEQLNNNNNLKQLITTYPKYFIKKNYGIDKKKIRSVILKEIVQRSISKIQFRVKDELSCYPLEAKAELVKGVLTVPLGFNQGVNIGKVGFASNNNPNHSMNDWVVLTVKKSSGDFSVIEPLNPQNKKENINGKIIRFMN